MSPDQRERVALFIDGANLHATARALDFDIDFGSLLEHFRQQGQFVRALYYTTVSSDDHDYSSLRPLLDWLDYNGFAIVTKLTKEYEDRAGQRRVKGSMDIELTVDALKLAPSLDHVVLFTGDGDFRVLVEAIQGMGRRVSVVSTLMTKPPMISDDLRRQADEFVDLADLEEFIARDRST